MRRTLLLVALILASCSSCGHQESERPAGRHPRFGFGIPTGFFANSAPVAIADFTSSCSSGGATVTRTGGTTVYPQTSATTVSTGVTGTVYENRGPATTGTAGGNMTGCWTFDQIPANVHALPFNHTCGNGTWSCSTNAPTVTIGAATAPDGTTTGDQISASAGNRQYVYTTGGLSGSTSGTVYIHSDWGKNGSPVPTVTGGVSTSAGNSRGVSFFNPTAWTRFQSWDDQWDVAQLMPKGFTAYTGFTDSASGATLYWGDYLYGATISGVSQHAWIYDPPLVVAASAAQTIQLSSSQAAQFVSGGNLDVQVCWISHVNTDGLYNTPDAWIWTMTSADGLTGVKYVAEDGPAFEITVRGVALGSTTYIDLANTANQKEICDRLQYSVSQGKWHHVITGNGATELEQTGTTTGTALATPTSAYLGSNLGATPMLVGQFTTVKAFAGATVQLAGAGTPEGVIIGDSISGRNSNQPNSGFGFYTITEGRTRAGIINLAHHGDLIADQNTAYLASPVKGNASVKWFLISEIGVNDAATNRTAAQMETDLTTLFNNIRTNNASAKIVISTGMPAHAALTAGQYTAYTTYQQWILANSLAADAVTHQATDDLSDGSDPVGSAGGGGSLSAICDVGDHLHPTSKCRDIMMVDHRAVIHGLGLI